jgi:xylulokinase
MFLGIDCGTQGTKALVIDELGQTVAQGYASHRLIERPNGAREQDPRWWVDAMQSAVAAALRDSSVDGHRIHCMAVSGQQHGLVILDDHGEPIRPAKLWNDTETAPQNAELLAAFGGAAIWQQKFGIVPLTGYTISKLLWLRQNEPESFDRICHILLPHDYLNYWLTGELVTEAGDASGSAYYDPRTREWAAEPLDYIDGGSNQLRAALPALIPPDQIIGKLLSPSAAALGLSQECMVAAGGGDNMMGAIGTGNVREGRITMSLGTSGTVYRYSEKPIEDSTGQVASFCSSTGGWLPLVCTMNMTNVTARVAQTLGREVSFLSEALRNTKPGADGITVLPFLNGERTPDLPTATASILGLNPGNFSAENVMRAAVEGVSFGILAGLQLILDGQKADRIILIGGGARSPEWRQLIADASGTPVDTPVSHEAASLGAALQSMWAWLRFRGETLTIDEIAQAYVRMRARASLPRPDCFEQYRIAAERYNQQLRAIYQI